MKKLLLSIAVAFSAMASYAQSAAGSLSLIPKVGINIANLTDYDDSKVRVGVAAGAELQYMFNDMVGIEAGAIYSQQGCKFKISNADCTIKLDYVNIPILANVYVVKGLAVKLGIQPAFKVNSSAKLSSQVGDLERDDDAVKSFDFSIPVGLSYEYANFVLDARYNFGCTKVVDDDNAKNSVFQITLGYKFGL